MNDTHILTQFDKLVTLLTATQGTNAKIEILQTHSELKPLIRRIWDPETKTGVTLKGLQDYRKKNKPAATTAPGTLYELFDALTARTLTGDAARAAIWAFVARHPAHEALVLGIMEKNVRIRLGATLLLKAFPGIFRIFRVCLAEEYTQAIFDREYAAANNRAWISKKIDGVRLITIVRAGAIKFYSRAGNEWTSLDALRADIAVLKLTDVVFDGELVSEDAEGRENFKKTVSESRKLTVQMENPRYKIIDMMSLATFEGAEPGDMLADRFEALDRLDISKLKHCEILEQTPYTTEAFERLAAQAKREAWEGLMIRMNARYEAKRTKKLLKYKFMHDEEFKVESVTIEDMPFPNSSGGETRIRAVKNAIILYKGNPVHVGSGFDKEERIEFAKHPELLVGKMITVQYQEPFEDAKTKLWSLRCPIFKGLR
jgi:DNA ligase-1